MNHSEASAISLQREGTTTLYVDAGSQSYPWAFWLAVPGTTPPDTITLAQAWSQYAGYLVFLDSKPSNYSALEQALQSALSTPAHTGFAWIRNDDVSNQWTLQVDASEVVTDSVMIAPGLNLPNLDIKANTPVKLVGASSASPRIELTCPAVPAHRQQPPSQHVSRPGVTVPLSGSQLGAAVFQALAPFPGDDERPIDAAARNRSVVVPLWDIVFDPLRPSRNRTSFTGIQFRLSESSGVFAIEGL